MPGKLKGSSRCLPLDPQTYSLPLLCPGMASTGSLALWILVTFSQWEAPVGEGGEGKGEPGVSIPPGPSLQYQGHCGLSLDLKDPFSNPVYLQVSLTSSSSCPFSPGSGIGASLMLSLERSLSLVVSLHLPFLNSPLFIFYFLIFLTTPCSIWDLSSLTRD